MRDGVADPVRILHVDDEPDLAELTATYLERDHERFTVETATNAGEGLERLDSRQFDCVVSDHDMPGRNGIEFLEAIREEYPDLPVILFTGKGSEELASDAISAGVTDYLQKGRGTSQYTVLANRIANAVEQYRARRARRERRRRRDRQWDALLELTTDAAVTGGEFKTAIARITETAADVLGVPRVNVWLFDDDGDTLRCVDHFERDAANHESDMELVANEYPAYFEALEGSRSIAAGDALEDPRTAELGDYLREHGVRSLLDATIRAEGEVVGMVCHENVGSPRKWTDDEVDFASDVADLVHRALRNRERVERASEFEASRARFHALKNDRLEEFASVVSHELRNPLNVASGRLEYAAADPDGKHYDAVENAHERMRTLIEDLLTLARQEKSATEREPVDLAATAEAGYANVDIDGATLAIETNQSVMADESRLKQVFENLFRNAVEHGHENVTVTVGDLADGFYVEDDGPGIPEAERADVFESGYSTSESGTGFGLRIVEQVVEAHGWEIVATEGTAGGARFEVTGVGSDAA